MEITLGIITTAAILDSINPCAISVLLLTIGFLISLGKSSKEIFKIGFFYVIGLYITYLLIGLGVLRALFLFGITNIFAKIGAIILALTALITLAGYFIPNFPIKLKIPEKSHKLLAIYIQKAGYPSIFILGILVGLFEFPCTGGVYISILTLIHNKTTVLTGILYLLYYNFIFVSPLLGILLFANSPIMVEKLDSWRKKNTKSVDIVSSLLMLVLSIIIFKTV